MNRSEDFLKKIDELAQQPIPAEVMERARKSLLDYLAVTCAGAAFQKEKLEKYFAFAGPEEGKYRAVGTGRDLVLSEAVFLNGLNGHALDFDDGTNSGIIHLGSPIYALLLPLAQKHGIGIEDLLRAAVIGYETSYTMAVSIQPGHKARGFHATGTCGVLGASIAASYMLGFSEEERFNAFASAAVAASGMLKVLDDGSELKPYNVAKAALLALTAVRMAKAGFQGHPDPLGGGRGYFFMMTGQDDVEMKPVMAQGTYAIMKAYVKPYASCRYTHPSVEAAILLKNRFGITPADAESIDIRTYDLAVAGHDHTEIPGPYSAKMSIPFSVAAALKYGKAGLLEFSEESVRDPELMELTSKVRVAADRELSDAFPAEQTAVLTIRTKGGSVTERVDFPKGEPENPMTEEEFRVRFDGLCEYAGMDAEKTDGIFNKIYGEDVPADEIMKLV